MDRIVLVAVMLTLGLVVQPSDVRAQSSDASPKSEEVRSAEAADDASGPETPSDETTTKIAESEVDAETKPAAPLRGPKYINLRYNDDFSYLDGPEGSYKPDIFDPIKWIHLTDDLTLSLGGEARVMVHSLTNPGFGGNIPTQDTYLWHRYFLHADLRYRKLLRVFAQGVHAEIEDQNFPLRAGDEDRFDFHQLFMDARILGENTPVTLRVGRQEMQYGKQRLVSPLDWANTRRSFDGVKLMYQSEKLDVDVWYMKPVPIDLTEGLNRKPNEYRTEQDFYGIYSTYKGIPNHEVDAYFMALVDDGDLMNANFRRGDLSLYTLGGRIGGKFGDFDYDGELAGQWGSFAGDKISAWMAGVDAGYTFSQVDWKPRIGVGFDWGSGDRDSTDNKHSTFNQLFPLGHAYLGYLDLVARQNVIAPNVNLTLTPHERVVVKTTWMGFWADSPNDALYNAGGGVSRRDRFRNPGHELGNELDLTIEVKVDAHQSLLFGYSHFWASNFIAATGASRDADFLYMGYTFKF